MEVAMGHNGAPFDFFEFFDTVVGSSATTTEKLMALITGRHIGRNGEAAYPSRARIMQQASCSENTFQRSLGAMRLFFEVEQRLGRTTLYRPKPIVTVSEIELALEGLRARTPPQNGASQRRGIPQNDGGGAPQNGAGVHPKMGRHKIPLKDPVKGEEESPDGDMSSDQLALDPNDPPRMTASRAAKIAFDLYNETAARCGLPIAKTFPDARKRALALRVKEAGGIDGFKQALANLEKSAFLHGQNDRGWRANIDFVCQPSSFAKLFEGGYGNGVHASGKTGGSDYAKNGAWTGTTLY